MKLKDTFVTYFSDGQQIMTEAGGEHFMGIVRSNASAAYIVDLLGTDTTKEDIVTAMCEKYDAPRSVISQDVEKILDKLRSIGALDE